MSKLTDHEFLSLVAHALHQSGPEGNPERANLNAAYTRAAAIIGAISGAGVLAIREERRYRRPWVELDSDVVEAEDAG